jgi:hypothetical protein
MEENESYQCPHCKGIDLRKHGISSSGKKVFLCNNCGKYFSHNAWNTQRTCIDCGRSFISKKVMRCEECAIKKRRAYYNARYHKQELPHKPKVFPKVHKKNRPDVVCPFCGSIDTRLHSKIKQKTEQSYYCKSCNRYFPDYMVKLSLENNEENKMCMICGKIKHIADFYLKDKKYPYNVCRKCYKEQGHYFHKYGVTNQDYEDALKRQNNSCAICSKPFIKGIKKCIDHCHSTGDFRGILCLNCNMLLGFCKDNTTILYSSINYLDKFNNDPLENFI